MTRRKISKRHEPADDVLAMILKQQNDIMQMIADQKEDLHRLHKEISLLQKHYKKTYRPISSHKQFVKEKPME